MQIIPTPIEGCLIIEPTIIRDSRGYFSETFNERTFAQKTGVSVHFVQDNQSFSERGVLRGLHYQTGEHAQAKLVRVLSGEVYDVALDIRPGSPTYGQHFGIVLSAENQRQFYIPRGFAHGFAVLSETATFFYKCDNFYDKASEAGVSFRDPSLGIDWMLDPSEMIISQRDQNLPLLAESVPVW